MSEKIRKPRKPETKPRKRYATKNRIAAGEIFEPPPIKIKPPYKVSESNKEKIRKANVNKFIPDWHCKLVSENRSNRVVTEETKDKFRKTLAKRRAEGLAGSAGKPVYLDGGFYKNQKFDSISAAKAAIGLFYNPKINKTTMQTVLKNEGECEIVRKEITYKFTMVWRQRQKEQE